MKKHWMTTLLAVAFAPAMFAEELSAFRLSKDQHMVRTADGAEAGRLEYLIVKPAEHRIVSAVITGGVIGEKLVAIPIEQATFAGSGVINLQTITKDKLTMAPELEKTALATTSVDSALFEKAFEHFGVQPGAIVQTPGVEPPARSGQQSPDSRVSGGAPAPRTPGEKTQRPINERLPLTPGRTTATPGSPNTNIGIPPKEPTNPEAQPLPPQEKEAPEVVGEKLPAPEKRGGINKL